MANVNAWFIQNDSTLDTEIVIDPPADLASTLPTGFSLIQQSIPEEDYNNAADPNYKKFRLLSYINDYIVESKKISDIDFKKEVDVRFYQKKDVVYGRVVRITHYPYVSGNPDFNTPILKEEIDYKFDTKDMVEKTEHRLTYWKNDTTSSLEKTFDKNYLPPESFSEDEDRRKCVICIMKADMLQVLIDEGKTLADAKSDIESFLDTRQGEIDKLTHRGVTAFIDNIAADTSDTFLQQTLTTQSNQLMKDFILDRIDYPDAETQATSLEDLYKGSA